MKTKLTDFAVAVTYSKEIGKHHFDFNARWVHEFESRKRVEGDLFAFSATFKL